jgi:hypothetical protein
MATNDLAAILDRVELYLMDVNNKSWDTTTLTEAIKQALTDLSQAAGVALAIKDLDSAAATTVEAQDLGVLVQGAAAYAASSRTVKRTEMVSIGEGPQTTLKAWAALAMETFKDRMKTISQRTLHKSTAAPHTAMEWEEEPKNY